MPVFFSLLALLALATTPTAQVTPDSLTPAVIEQAIDRALQIEPRPYGFRLSQPLEVGPAVVDGAPLVFTPYVRVQIAAWRAWVEDGHRMTAGEVTPDLIEPVVLIAVTDVLHRKWPGAPGSACAGEGEIQAAVFPLERPAAPGPRSILDFRNLPEGWGEAPVWQEDHSWLLPESFRGTVVAFPLTIFEDDLDLFVKHPDHDSACHGSGLWIHTAFTIRSADVAHRR